MIGTVLSNRYKLIAELGSGGMAWVYLAEDLAENHRVAVKVLYPQYSQDLGFLQRFIREAKLSMTLSQGPAQQYIVSILDYGADRDTHYLVMEYVQGRDLGQVLQQEGPLSWQRALSLARQVALALDHACQLEIVHRDIKPSNIMLLPDGTARVTDFGIARARSSPSLTLSGFVGSPHYAAPEQATGQPVDIRADIYSLGIVLYRMLSGNLPFQADTPWAVVNQHILAAPPSLAECCPDLPDQVVQLVDKAMAKRPEDRFQTPQDMVQAIDAVLAGHDLPFEPLVGAPIEAALALEPLYDRAQQAVEAERWQEAVDLYSQILKIDPDYRDVTEQLAGVGQQIRLANLYRSAQRALQNGQWDRALTQLDRIAEVDPGYKELASLRVKAEQQEVPESDGARSASEFPTQAPPAGTEAAEAPNEIPSAPAGAPAAPIPPTAAPDRRRRWLWIGIPLLALLLAAALYLAFSAQRPDSSPAAGLQPSPSWTAQPTTPTARATTAPTPVPTIQTPAATQPSRSVQDTPEPTPTASPWRSSTRTPTTTRTPTPSASATETATETATATATKAATAAVQRTPTGQIAFPRFDPARGTYDVYACRVDGSGCRRVSSEASQPDFLPDGTRLVVHSWKADEKGLILLESSGQPIWRITGEIEAARPSVDFQGQTYIYHSRHESDRQTRLFRTYEAETRPIVREASPVLGRSPSWLPDRRILYSGCWQNSCGILVMNDDGAFPRQVVAGTSEINPESSPKGQQVAFMSQRQGNWDVYVANLDGSNLRRLTDSPANDGLPAWSPDGRTIAFVTDREGPWAIWAMRPDGSQQRRLFEIGGPLDGQVRDAAPHESHGWVEERISWAPYP